VTVCSGHPSIILRKITPAAVLTYMTKPRPRPQTAPAKTTPVAVIGAILAQGVIRLLDLQNRVLQLAIGTEESVHVPVLITKEDTNE
jgi:hypothetical protein